MTTFRIALEELLRKTGVDDFDFLREGLRVLAQGLMELEVSQRIGADRYERSAERSTYRNGYRERQWDTRVGTIDLQIPKLRKGSYMPSFLEPRRRAEKALVAVVLEAYVNGVSTRKVLLPALFGSDLTCDSVVRQLTRWFVARIGGGRPAGRPC